MAILLEKTGGDSELLVYSMTLVNKVSWLVSSGLSFVNHDGQRLGSVEADGEVVSFHHMAAVR